MGDLWYNGVNYISASRAVNTEALTHRSRSPMSTPDSTTKSKKVFIYVLQRISDKAYLYIGSANNPYRRFTEHRWKNPHLVIQEAFKAQNIRFLVIAETDEEHRIEVESRLWQLITNAGHPIVNRDPSIITLFLGNKGHVHSAETRRKISEARKGKPSHNKGKHPSPETLRKISQSRMGKKLKPHSEETKRKISEAQKGRPSPLRGRPGKTHTEEAKQKMSQAHKGKSPSNKGVPHNEETRRKMREAWKTRPPVSEESRRKMSESAKTARARRREQQK